jgi:GntR family transcriptional regulator
MLRGETPVELSRSYYPASWAAGTALAGRGKIRGGAPAVLAELGYPERGWTDRISTRPPTTEEVEVLEIPQGVPVLRQFRRVYTDGDRPVEVSVLIKPGHLYELEYQQELPAES